MSNIMFLNDLRWLLCHEHVPFEEQQVGFVSKTFYIPSVDERQISIHCPDWVATGLPYEYDLLDHRWPGDKEMNIVPSNYAEVATYIRGWASENVEPSASSPDDLLDIDLIRQEAYPDEEGIARYYLGTVFSLTPSGKYYMPWACSNVTDKEAEADSDWWDALDSYLEKFNMWSESGEGDPCDIFVCFFVEEKEQDEW